MKQLIAMLVLMTVLVNAEAVERESIKLRHGYSYTFWNTMTSKGKAIWISDFNGTTFSENNGDYNGGKNPSFGMPASLITKAKKYQVHLFEGEKNVKIIESKSKYSIDYYPLERKKNNLMIKYVTNYYIWKKEEKKWSEIKKDVSLQPYEITWCGDGVVDHYIDKYSKNQIIEECDPKDDSKKNWGSAGCASSCKTINLLPVKSKKEAINVISKNALDIQKLPMKYKNSSEIIKKTQIESLKQCKAVKDYKKCSQLSRYFKEEKNKNYNVDMLKSACKNEKDKNARDAYCRFYELRVRNSR